MQASTVVTRTEAGSAELATPSHGLSLAQRRFLTLLDTGRTLDELSARVRADPDKLRRDLTRLASLGLVAYDAPAANEPDAAPGGVRLGAPGASRRLAFVLVPLVLAALAWFAWRALSAPPASPAAAATSAAAPATPAVTEQEAGAPQAIATKVLRGDPAPAPQGKEAAKAADTGRAATPTHAARPPQDAPKPNSEASAPRPAASDAPSIAAERSAGNASPASGAPAFALPALPVERLRPIPLPAPPPEPVRLASIAPAAPAPAAKLVPVAQETPAFPREAIAAGLATGNVKARVTVDAKGAVSGVEIVQASHRAFDRAVRDALVHWRFEPGAAWRTTTVDVAFRRD